MHRMSIHRCRGFGLFEQIMTLLVLAVLVTIAVPPFRRLLDDHALNAAQADYIAALRHARGMAINEQTRVIFCASRTALACNDDNAWSDGWLIGRDPDGAGQPDGDPVQTGGKHDRQLAVLGTDGRKGIRFKPDGSVGNTNQTLLLCLRGDARRALTVVISTRGRILGRAANTEQMTRCEALD